MVLYSSDLSVHNSAWGSKDWRGSKSQKHRQVDNHDFNLQSRKLPSQWGKKIIVVYYSSYSILFLGSISPRICELLADYDGDTSGQPLKANSQWHHSTLWTAKWRSYFVLHCKGMFYIAKKTINAIFFSNFCFCKNLVDCWMVSSREWDPWGKANVGVIVNATTSLHETTSTWHGSKSNLATNWYELYSCHILISS